MKAILEAARAAYAAGLARAVENTGSKTPDVPRWKHYQHHPPSVAEMRAFDFAAHYGLGIIAGAGSGHRECWDFDTDEVFVAFVERAHSDGTRGARRPPHAGLSRSNPKGGDVGSSSTYPASLMFKDCTLARRPGRDDEPPIKTLIELPTFAIVAPSNGRTHPSGKPYERLRGGFDHDCELQRDERQALFSLAQDVRRDAACGSAAAVTDRSRRRHPSRRRLQPTDDVAGATRATWLDDGVRSDGVTYWRRPGKTVGVSATTNYGGSDSFYPFTSSTVFEPDKSYSKFAVARRGSTSRGLQPGGVGAVQGRLRRDVHGRASRTPAHLRQTRSTPRLHAPSRVRLTTADTSPLRPVRGSGKTGCRWDVHAGRAAAKASENRFSSTRSPRAITTRDPAGVSTGHAEERHRAATEDSWAHTIAPRLLAARSGLVTKVYRADIVDPDGFDLPLSLPKDTAALLAGHRGRGCGAWSSSILVVSISKPRLDCHKGRAMCAARSNRCRRWRMPRTSPSSGLSTSTSRRARDALTLLMASRAFAAVARSVLFVAVNPDDDEQRRLAGVRARAIWAVSICRRWSSRSGACWCRRPRAATRLDGKLIGRESPTSRYGTSSNGSGNGTMIPSAK